jgi:hypothetical protein
MQRWTTEKNKPVLQLAFRSRNNEIVATVLRRNRPARTAIACWNISGSPVFAPRLQSIRSSLPTIALPPKGDLLAVLNASDESALLYSWETGESTMALDLGRGWYGSGCIAFSPSSELRHQWVAGAAKSLILRNPHTSEILATIDDGLYTAMTFNLEGTELYAINDFELKRFQIKPTRELFSISLPKYEHWYNLAFSPIDSGRVIVQNVAGDLIAFRLNGSKVWENEKPVSLGRTNFALTAGSDRIGILEQERLLLVDVLTGQTVREYDWQAGKLTAVAFSADGTVGVVGSATGYIVVFDMD